MARTDHVDQVQVVVLDQPVEMHVQKVQARCRAPVPEQARLDVLKGQRFLEERIATEVDLAHRQIVRGAPPGVHPADQLRSQPCHGQ